MKTIDFLGDIEDEETYAKSLETAWHLVLEQLAAISARFPIIYERQGKLTVDFESELANEIDSTYDELAQMMHVMRLLGRDMADRRKRLADRAVGLADVELHEQRTEE